MLLLAFVLVASGGPSQAAPLTLNAVGLDWLADPAETFGLSRTQLLAKLADGQPLDDFRYATSAESSSLFAALYPDMYAGDLGVLGRADAEQFIDDFGMATYAAASIIFGDVAYVSYFALFGEPVDALVGQVFWEDASTCSGPTCGGFAGFYFDDDSFSGDGVFSLLVREQPGGNQVPVPATALLTILGLASIWSLRRRISHA
jgi:hypothetical protein